MEALACTEFGGVRTLDLCRCRWSRSSFELDRCKHAKRRVSALAVVEDLEVVKSLPGPAVGGEGGGVSVQLCLEQPHDRFSHRIVEAVADGPDRGGGTYLVDPFGVEDRGVLLGFKESWQMSLSRLVFRRVQAAMLRASTTRAAVMERAAFQPTSRREQTSMTKAM